MCAGVALREASLKQKINLLYDARVIRREFEVGNLVLKRNHKEVHKGKLYVNWEGPYRVQAKMGIGAYYLENLNREQLARPWNAENLKQYYS